MALKFFIKQNDTSPSLKATLLASNGLTQNLSGSSVVFQMRNSESETYKINASASLYDAGNGIVEYEWQEGDTDTAGFYQAEFEVTYFDGKKETFPNVGNIYIEVVSTT